MNIRRFISVAVFIVPVTAVSQDFKSGIEYLNGTNKCVATVKEECVAADRWQQLCTEAKGVTKAAFTTLALDADYGHGAKDVRVLVENAEFRQEKFMWADREKLCLFSAEFSGIVKGNSMRKKIYGNVTNFIKVDGEILAHRMFYIP